MHCVCQFYTISSSHLNPRLHPLENLSAAVIPGVHDGFYASLFHRPEGSRVCLFDELVDLLKEFGSEEEAGSQLPLFLTGHSLGGAIASVFAAALRAEARL